jgi:hypothetical protein
MVKRDLLGHKTVTNHFANRPLLLSYIVGVAELEAVLERSSNWIASDTDIKQLDDWVERLVQRTDIVDAIEFCRLYGLAPDAVKKAFGLTRDKVIER